MSRAISYRENIRPIFAAIRTVPIPPKPEHDVPAEPVEPFITISREPGAGAWTLAQRLVEAINADGCGGRPWTCWDRELVEKVASDLHISQSLIDSLEEESHSWLRDFIDSFSASDTERVVDEDMAYRHVVGTIRALAQAGRVVIVGRGGVFVTRRMRGGIHIRLVAPLEFRVGFFAEHFHVSSDAARSRIKELERNRLALFRRFWPKETLSAETFTMTVNTAMLEIPAIVNMVKAMVRQPAGAAVGK